jgi:hypothetical protein
MMKAAIIALCIIAAAGSVVAAAFTVLNYQQVRELQEQTGQQRPINGNLPPLNQQQSGQNGATNQSQGQAPQGSQNGQPGGNGGTKITDHKVYVTRSSDPESFEDSTEIVFEKASVPDVVLLTQDSEAGDEGDLLMYFPSFENVHSPDEEQIAYSRSTDNGVTWSERESITMEGNDDIGTAVDPSLVQLSDGRLRMYFYGSEFTQGDPAQSAGDHSFYSAVSSDGVNFTVEDGVRFAAEKITDPEVVQHNGRWIMYISRGPETLIATSSDGLTFALEDEEWDGGGVPGAYVDDDGDVHLYGCGQGGIATQESTDGITFSESTEPVTALRSEDTTTPAICDPAPVLLPDGDVLMVYKKA